MTIALNGQAKSDAYVTIWSQNTEDYNTIPFQMTIDDNNIYCYKLNYVFCIDKNTGRILWTNKTNNTFYQNTTPIIYNDKVIYNGENIICLNKNNGNSIWTVDMSVVSEPIRISNKYYFLNNRKKLVLLDLDKVETIEEWLLDEPVLNMRIIDDDVIFTDLNKGQLSRYNLTTKRYLWKKYVDNNRISSPLVHDNKMLIVLIGNAKCISLVNGDLLWETKYHGGSMYPILYNDKIFVGPTCIDFLTGKVIWDHGYYVCNSVILDEKLYVFSPWCLTIHDIHNGDKVWSENIASPPGVGIKYYSKPVVSDNRIPGVLW